MLKIILVTLFAGFGAGVGTGFVGMSAAAVIAPMLATFLGVEPYTAIGIALASDVLASAVSAVQYGKNKNLDIKNGVVMMVCVLVMTIVGSLVSSKVEGTTMGMFSIVMTMLMGIKFIVKPVNTTKEKREQMSQKKKIIFAVVFGILVGFICGFVGAGGGMMMLFVLTSVLGYELKTAVGTSVFIMAFTALTGSVSHMVIGGFPDIKILILCVVFTLIFAQLASYFANRVSNKILNRIVGVVLTVLGIVMILFKAFAPAV